MDPILTEPQPDLTDVRAIAASVTAHFAFLSNWGFELAPQDTWERGDSLVVPFIRDDLAVLVAIVEGGLFLMVTRGPPEATTAIELISGALDDDNEPILFGSFPLPDSLSAIDRVLAARADNFREVATGLIETQPVNLADLLAATATTAAQLQRDVHQRGTEHRLQRPSRRDGGPLRSKTWSHSGKSML